MISHKKILIFLPCLCLTLCACRGSKTTSGSLGTSASSSEETVVEPQVEKIEQKKTVTALCHVYNVDAPVLETSETMGHYDERISVDFTITSQSTLSFHTSQGNGTAIDDRRYLGYLIRYASNEDMKDATELYVYPSAAMMNPAGDRVEPTYANREYLDDVTITHHNKQVTVTVDNLPTGTYWYELTFLNTQADDTASGEMFVTGHIDLDHWEDDSVTTDQTYDLDGGMSLIVMTDGSATLKGTGECGDIDATGLMGEDKAKALTSLTIEEGITNVKGFHNSGIKSLSLPDGYEAITSGSFSDNTYLHKVSFGDDVKAIEKDAFKNDTHLLTMTLPEKLESFSMIDSLEKLTFNDAFEDYTLIDSDNLKEVVIGKGLKEDMALFKDAKNLSHIVNRSDKTISFTSLDDRVHYLDPNFEKHTTLGHGDYMVRSKIPIITYVLGDAKLEGVAPDTYEYGKVTELPKATLKDYGFVEWVGWNEIGHGYFSGSGIDATKWKANGPEYAVPVFEDVEVTGGKEIAAVAHEQPYSQNDDFSQFYVVKFSKNKDMSDFDFLYLTDGFEKSVSKKVDAGIYYYTVQITGIDEEEYPESPEEVDEVLALSDVFLSGSVEID